jgi:hypothetical protein
MNIIEFAKSQETPSPLKGRGNMTFYESINIVSSNIAPGEKQIV